LSALTIEQAALVVVQIRCESFCVSEHPVRDTQAPRRGSSERGSFTHGTANKIVSRKIGSDQVHR